jgi:hypothetical protein
MISLFKTIRQYGAFALVFSSLSCAPSAYATFVMTIDDLNDGKDAIQVYDHRDGAYRGSQPGVFEYSGLVGGFDVNITAGIGKDADGRRVLSLNHIDATSSSAGFLVVTISDNFNSGNFYVGNESYSALTRVEGATQGTVVINALQESVFFANATLTSTFYQSTSQNLPFVPFRDNTAPFGITFLSEIIHDRGNSSTNFSASISPSPVPLPAAIWLFISALGGGGVFVRRMQKNHF